MTPVLHSKPGNTMYYYTTKPWPTVACYIDLEETPAWCILPWVLVSRMESVVALWTPHSWWLPWQEIILCIIYASSCTTPILHTLITHFTIHTYITSHAYNHAYMHTNIHECRCQTTTHGHSPALSLTNPLALAYSKEQLVLRYVLPYTGSFDGWAHESSC